MEGAELPGVGGQLRRPRHGHAGQATINCILSDYYCPEILDESYKFSISGTYCSPPAKLDRDQILAFIQNLPLQEYPEAFWLHQNADLTAKINEGFQIIHTAVGLLPRTSGGAGKSAEEIYSNRAKTIYEELPKLLYDIEAVQLQYPVSYTESLNTVLPQECGRYNKLLSKIKESLVSLQRAVKGEVVMTPELDAVGEAFLANKVPALWKTVSFASLKPLGSYIPDLLRRLAMFDSWILSGPPVLLDLGVLLHAGLFHGLAAELCAPNQVPHRQVRLELLRAVPRPPGGRGPE